MRGSPELPACVYSARVFQKRFPHRFLPSSRGVEDCTPRTTTEKGKHNPRTKADYRFAINYLVRISNRQRPTLTTRAETQIPIRSDSLPSRSDIGTYWSCPMHFWPGCDKKVGRSE